MTLGCALIEGIIVPNGIIKLEEVIDLLCYAVVLNLSLSLS